MTNPDLIYFSLSLFSPTHPRSIEFTLCTVVFVNVNLCVGPTLWLVLIDWSNDADHRHDIATAGRPHSTGSEALRALGAGLAGPERYGAVDRHCDRGGRWNLGRVCGPYQERRR